MSVDAGPTRVPQPASIRIENLSKAYRVGVRHAQHDSVTGRLAAFLTSPFANYRRLHSLDTFESEKRRHGEEADLIWALRDIDLTIRQGEVVGFVGANGAGKSTLLKIVSRITRPTKGSVALRGRVSSLLEVGTGFHPELTGRDNILMNGTILGMSRREIDRKFDEIVAFSGVGRFLDTPLKRYSSGMKVRLGFAVAAHLEPDILIVDEVLAVGDAQFQQRCLGKMQDVSRAGRTVLFVSHNLSAVQSLCTRAILLEEGRAVEDGSPRAVISTYLKRFTASGGHGFGPDNELRETRGPVKFLDGRMLDVDGRPLAAPVSGEPVTFAFDVENEAGARPVRLRLIFKEVDNTNLFSLHSGVAGADIVVDGRSELRVTIPKLPLHPGEYRIGAALITPLDGLSDRIPNAFDFEIVSSTFFPGGSLPPRRQGGLLVDAEWEARPAVPPAGGRNGE